MPDASGARPLTRDVGRIANERLRTDTNHTGAPRLVVAGLRADGLGPRLSQLADRIPFGQPARRQSDSGLVSPMVAAGHAGAPGIGLFLGHFWPCCPASSSLAGAGVGRRDAGERAVGARLFWRVVGFRLCNPGSLRLGLHPPEFTPAAVRR